MNFVEQGNKFTAQCAKKLTQCAVNLFAWAVGMGILLR